MKKTVQALVVGAGPAGSRAALALARAGIDTLMVDRNERPGMPVRCGEGIGGRGLRAAGLEPRPEWISSCIRRALFVSPSDTSVQVEKIEDAYILDRERFDFDLACQAKDAGAALVSRTTVHSIARASQGWLVGVRQDTNEIELNTQLLIGADGVDGRVGRLAGLCRTVALDDLETCAQYLLEGVEVDPDCCTFYTGQRRAPGGYAWVFPKGPGRANVGLGVLAQKSKECRPIVALDRFVAERFPKARILRRTVGGVPVGMGLDVPVGDGILLAGDAARQVNCLNGGGMSYALSAGYWAGEAGAEALKAGDLSARRLGAYVKQWKSKLGKQQKRSYHLKEALLQLNDAEIDRIARKIQSRSAGQVASLAGVFVPVFARRPRLLWHVMKLLG